MTLQKTKPRIIKIAWGVPHYRVGIFRRLSQNPNMDFTVCAGTSSEGWRGEDIASAKDTDESEGVNWHQIKTTRIKWPPFKSYEWQPDVIRYVLKNKPDAVIVLGISKSVSNWILLPLCKILRIPIIDWTQGVMGPESRIKWFIRKLLIKPFSAHMLYGEWARNWYASHGLKPERLFVIRNSLDYDKQKQVRESISQSDIEKVRRQFGVEDHNSRLLLHSGRLEPKKKLPMLFDALKVLKAKGRKVKLLLVGKGREEERLKEDVRQKDIEDMVIFYGACYDESILGRLITASDLTVVPGVVGLIAMHSLVYGTPLLARYNTAYEHCPEVEAVIEGQTGGYFKDGDVDDLVNKIEYMLYENPCKSRMTEACKKMIDQNFTPQYQEKMIIQALNYVLPADKQINCPSK